MKKREQGVLSVEASIVLTLTLLFILFLFSFGRVYRAQNMVSHATLQSADAVAIESYLRETALQTDAVEVGQLANQIADSDAISAESLESLRSANLPKIAKQKFAAAIANSEAKADEKLKSLGVKDGLAGVDFSECKMDLGNDDVIIAVKYTLKMQFPVFGYDEITVTKSAKAKTFGEILFEVSTKPNNPSWGSTSGDNKVVHGSTVQISATPNYGYKFVSWDDGNTDNPRKVTVTDAQSYTAIFERDSFGVNISTKIDYNSEFNAINHTGYGSYTGAGVYLYLDKAVLTAIPKEPQYQFKGWDLNGDGIIDDTNKTVTVTVDKTYNNIKAVFKPGICTVNVKANNSDYGNVSVQQGSAKGASIKVDYGSKVQLIATAKNNAKFSFVKWSHNDTNQSTNVIIDTLTASYEAVFKVNTYTVNFYNGSQKLHSTNVVCGSSIDGSKLYLSSASMYDGTKISGFNRWKKTDGSTFTSQTIVNNDIDVYVVLNCKITLNAKGGKVSWTSKTIERGTSVTLPTPTLSGHNFKGWKASNGRTYNAGNSYTFSGNIELIAQWSCKHETGNLVKTYRPDCRDIYSDGKLKSGAEKPYNLYKCTTCGDEWKVSDDSLRKHYRMDQRNGNTNKDDFKIRCDEKHPDAHYGYCGKFYENSEQKHKWDGRYHILCKYCEKEDQGVVWCKVEGELVYREIFYCAKHNEGIKSAKCPCN